jgi:dTDP-4-dehydrorhamnose reductase
MKILLFGSNGQLGWELHRTLSPLGSVAAFDYPQVDLNHQEQIISLIREERPQLIVNAAAYTAVDRAESEPKLAFAVNHDAPGTMAKEAKTLGAGLIHYSTDYVFDGNKKKPYLETDPPHPLSVYAQSKLEGEKLIQDIGGNYLIFRTSWVYSLRGNTFVKKILAWSRQQKTLRVVDDQIGNPTWARMLAEITSQVVTMGIPDIPAWLEEHRGLYHLAGSGYASRLEWARAILAYDPHPHEQTVERIESASTTDFPTPAQRPLFSALDCELFHNTFGPYLPHWQEALRLALAENH